MDHLLSCSCPGCKAPVPVHELKADAGLACAACGRSFTLGAALQPNPDSGPPPPPRPAAPALPVRTQRSRRILALAGAALIVAAAWLMRPDVTAERDAVRAFCAPLAATDAAYPRAAHAIRQRAWLASSASQPDGVALFTRLAAPDFGGTVAIDGGRLRELLAPLRNHVFLPRLGIWAEDARSDEIERNALALADVAKRGIRHTTRDGLARLLQDGLADATAARAMLDLLAGRPADGSPDLARRMLLEGDFPQALLLRGFSGRDGERMIDQGRPPYLSAHSPYQGLLLRCIGRGWDSGYRVLTLDKPGNQAP